MMSLRTRVVLSAAAVLSLSVLLISVALERAVRDTAESAREERLLAQLYLLMAEAEVDGDRLTFPGGNAEARLSLPDSGLSARVFDAAARPVWQSASAVGVAEPTPLRLAPGDRQFELRRGPDGIDSLRAAFGVSWATGAIPRQYTFAVAEQTSALEREVARFRASLAGWLAAMSLLMLLALVLTLRWGLAPLRRVAAEVSAVETGEQARIQGTYPSEIGALTGNLNALLAHERARYRRLDDALGDLAHSLKTPLAVIRGAIAEHDPDGAHRPRLDLGQETRGLLHEQLTRMGHIIEYQLNRARTGSRQAPTLASPVPVGQVVERLVAALAKVYPDKGVKADVAIDAGLRFRGVEGDLLEMLGNLLDNAFKWCAHRVRVAGGARDGLLVLTVEDDGPGISPGLSEWLLERGTRADETTPGHGIGLAVVRDTCEAYGGSFRIERGALGGARCVLGLPG